MDLLAICKMIGREGRTVAPAAITSVVNQTGRIGEIVAAAQEAYRQIESQRPNWNWKRATYSQDLSAGGTGRYAPAALGVTRFGSWARDDLTKNPFYFPHTIYLTSVGVDDEGYLTELTWPDFRTRYLRGAQNPNKPEHYCIAPDRTFRLGPIPSQPVTINGEYFLGPQALTENTSTPEMPEEFHPLIGWRGLQLLLEGDEAGANLYLQVKANADAWQARLDGRELPQVTVGGFALA